VREPEELPEVPFENGSLVIGDAHLDVGPGASEPAEFLRWLAALEHVPHLVILGDLFDAWIGPAQARLPAARAVLAGLRRLTAAGTEVDLVPGNRDFLLEETFERESGARIRPGGLIGTLAAQVGPVGRVLLVHGDELCTLDLGYQRLKRVVRSAPARWRALRLPAPAAVWAAKRLRKASVRAVAAKPPAAKAQQELAVRTLGLRHACATLVCGHAHVFRDVHPSGGPRWIVVDAYGGARDLVRVGPSGELAIACSRDLTRAGASPAPRC